MHSPVTADIDSGPSPSPAPSGFWKKEDWWAVWIGLALILAAWAFFAAGSSLDWIAVYPSKWANAAQLTADLAAKWPRYLAQAALFLALFGLGAAALGYRLRKFAPSFLLIYAVSLLINIAGTWIKASTYTLEPPLIALFLGLAISNLALLPRGLDAGFRVEFYVKTGIVLLGAGLPLSLIVWGGPVAILQASIVSLATFFVIFWTGRRLGLDRQLAAILGAGGAVCGVSAAIAVAGAVRSRKEYPPIAITLVVLYAIAFVFLLPLCARALHLPTGVGGAWIGTSEFADAAGLAAAQGYGGLAGSQTGITGTPEQAVNAYTLIKVVGRDVWIGIWAFVLSIVSITRWESSAGGCKADPWQIWSRFPKFVIGFLIASLLITLAIHNVDFATYNKVVKPALVQPLVALRTWAFTFSFLSIGLTTRFRDLAPAGSRPFLAFTAGVIVNLLLGYILSVHVFGAHWAALGH